MIKLLATHPQWNYMILQDLGYSIEMKENSVNEFFILMENIGE